MRALRRGILALGLIGCTLFSAAFIASWANPGLVEHAAKSALQYEVEKRVQGKLQSLNESNLTTVAEALWKTHADEIDRLKLQLADRLPARIALIVGEMQNLDCACRQTIQSSVRRGMEGRLGSLAEAQERLTLMIRSKYMETAGRLMREFRIFTGINAIAFGLMAITVLFKRRAGVQLVPVALVLLVATTVTACLYLFDQNWLHTLVFNDFVGFAYVGHLAAVFALLSDIVFNRARVTATGLNSLLGMIGSAIQITPC